MTREKVLIAVALVAAASTASLFAAQWHVASPRNFHVVQDGVLYRSGQLTPEQFEKVLDDSHIKTVVTLRTGRDPGKPYSDEWEKEVCATRGLKHVRILPRSWAASASGDVPADQSVREFLAIMDDPANHPVLVHCFAGRHRTGALCAVFRMQYQNWTFEEAAAELRKYGFGPGGWRECVECYLRDYRPR